MYNPNSVYSFFVDSIISLYDFDKNAPVCFVIQLKNKIPPKLRLGGIEVIY